MDTNEEYTKKVFIKAQSVRDCDIISALLQDSIFEISGCHYLKKEKCLRLLLNRFCWEHSHKFDEEECYHRVHTGLYIHNVKSIKTNNLFSSDGSFKTSVPYLNLLAVHASESEINLVFSDKKHMCVEVENILVYLKDLHEKYPTLSKPEHQVA